MKITSRHQFLFILISFIIIFKGKTSLTKSQFFQNNQQPIPFYSFQGFGSNLTVNYSSQFLVNNQKSFQQALKSNALITLTQNLKITLTSNILLTNLSNVYINGQNAQITQFGIYIQNCSNIVLYNLRITNASFYGVLIKQSHRIIVDHCTILDASRNSVQEGKGIDLTEASSTIIVSWNIIGYTYPIVQLIKYKGMLIANFKDIEVTNVSLHHNIFYCNYQRSPQILTQGLFDMRNNVIFNYTQYGTRVRQNAYGNFIQNWYLGGKKDPLLFQTKLNIYSSKNIWRFQNKQTKVIQEIKTHNQFDNPKITQKSLVQTVNEAGCVQKGVLQKIILKNIQDMLKGKIQQI